MVLVPFHLSLPQALLSFKLGWGGTLMSHRSKFQVDKNGVGSDAAYMCACVHVCIRGGNPLAFRGQGPETLNALWRARLQAPVGGVCP